METPRTVLIGDGNRPNYVGPPRWAMTIKERGETPLGHPIGRRCHHRGSHRHTYVHTYTEARTSTRKGRRWEVLMTKVWIMWFSFELKILKVLTSVTRGKRFQLTKSPMLFLMCSVWAMRQNPFFLQKNASKHYPPMMHWSKIFTPRLVTQDFYLASEVGC